MIKRGSEWEGEGEDIYVDMMKRGREEEEMHISKRKREWDDECVVDV